MNFGHNYIDYTDLSFSKFRLLDFWTILRSHHRNEIIQIVNYYDNMSVAYYAERPGLN